MQKKKIIAALALASVLVVGTGVATISFGNGTEVLATGETTNNVVTGKAVWNFGTNELVTENGNYRVPVEVFDVQKDNKTIGRGVFVKEHLQKIKSITFTCDKEGGTLYVDPAYYDDVNKETVWNKTVHAVNNVVTFAEGHYISQFTAKSENAYVTKLEVEYVCNNKEAVFDDPVLKAGWYAVGSGSIVTPGEGHDWNSSYGTFVADKRSNEGTLTVKKGDEFKITDTLQQNWLNFDTGSVLYNEGYLKDNGGNAVVLKDCTFKLQVIGNTVKTFFEKDTYYLVGDYTDGSESFWAINSTTKMTKQDDGSYQIISEYKKDGHYQIKDYKNDPVNIGDKNYFDIAAGNYLFTLRLGEPNTLSYSIVAKAPVVIA